MLVVYNKQQWKDEIPDLTKPIKDSSGKQKTDPQTGRPLYELVQEGTRLTSQRLNHIEDGIETVHELADQNAADIDTHKEDTVKHITAAERAEWKAKETPAGAQTKADAALSSAKTYADTALLVKADKSSTYSKTETDQRIQAVVGAAPDALDTLKEIGDALNNDPNFAATVTNQLSGKVDKVSGKQLSTEDYSSAEKAKLAGLTPGAGAAGSATDATIGNRTADPSIATPYSLTGSITQWFSWITKYFKAITGKANPFDAPDITLAATKTHVDNTTVHITAAERTAWNTSIPRAEKGAVSGVASLDANADVYDEQIPPNIARKATEITKSATDLNTITTEGEYLCTSNALAVTFLNMPPTKTAFHLKVSKHAGFNQTFTTFNTVATGGDRLRMYTRNFYGSTWGEWVEIENTNSKNVANGYAGLDNNVKVPRANTYSSLSGGATIISNLNTLLTAGTYSIAASTVGAPETLGGQVMVNVSYGELHDNATNWIWQLFFSTGGSTYVRRKINEAAWQPWVPLWTGYNDSALMVTRTSLANGSDFNSLTTNGVYALSGATGLLNAPPNILYGIVSVSRTDGSSPFVKQEATDVLTGATQTRFRTGSNTWTPWATDITSTGGTMEAPLTRKYSPTLMKYQNVAGFFDGGTGVSTGTIKITLPAGWTNTMLNINIRGYNYSSITGSWELKLGGYNYSTTPVWMNTSAELEGKAPFTSVRFAYDGAKCCILLGTTTTVWNYPAVELSEVTASASGANALGGAWTVTLLTSETGITNVTSQTISYGNANTLNGYSPDTSSTANTIPVRDSNKKIAEVAATRAVSSEVQLTTTAPVVVSTYVAKVSAMYTVLPYLRVMADGKTVTLVVNYTSLSGAKSRVVLPPTLMPINDYDFIPVTLNAQANSTITIVATTNSANGVFVSAILREEG